MIDVAPPPAIYDHQPAPPFMIATLADAEVRRICRGRVACALPKRRMVVISGILEGEEREQVLRHELAHLNGWIH